MFEDNTMELIYLVKTGNKMAYYELCQRYYHIVKKMVRKSYHYRLGSVNSDDLIQIGMICFDKALYSYREDREASFSTFIRVCISNKLMTALRDDQTRSFYDSLDASLSKADQRTLLDIVPDGHTDYVPDIQSELKEVFDKLGNYVLNHLNYREKQVFHMFILGYKPNEIADELQVNLKTVYNLNDRILKKIRTVI